MKKPQWIALAAAAVLLVGGIVLAMSLGGGREKAAELLDGAVAYLKQLEAGDPDQVLSVIRDQQKARMEAERDEMRDKLLNGEIDVWSQFQDFAMFGDSRVAGYYYYNLLPNERILANAGDTIKNMEERIPDLVALHPARVYISYGINDINIGFWATKEEYTADLERILGLIEEAVPGIEIYVNSILEVQDWALYKGEKWKYAPEYSEAIREMCRQHGYTYIDNKQLTDEHQDLYESDGLHFQPGFYKYWATNQILATYYRDAEEEFDS